MAEKITLDNPIFDKCKWCNGSGDDGGGYNACPDCESTGMKGGRYALKKHDELVDEEIRQISIKNGYIAEDGAPLKCQYCESKNLASGYGYEETMMVEQVVHCKDCRNLVGCWSYGAWEI